MDLPKLKLEHFPSLLFYDYEIGHEDVLVYCVEILCDKERTPKPTSCDGQLS